MLKCFNYAGELVRGGGGGGGGGVRPWPCTLNWAVNIHTGGKLHFGLSISPNIIILTLKVFGATFSTQCGHSYTALDGN